MNVDRKFNETMIKILIHVGRFIVYVVVGIAYLKFVKDSIRRRR